MIHPKKQQGNEVIAGFCRCLFLFNLRVCSIGFSFDERDTERLNMQNCTVYLSLFDKSNKKTLCNKTA